MVDLLLWSEVHTCHRSPCPRIHQRFRGPDLPSAGRPEILSYFVHFFSCFECFIGIDSCELTFKTFILEPPLYIIFEIVLNFKFHFVPQYLVNMCLGIAIIQLILAHIRLNLAELGNIFLTDILYCEMMPRGDCLKGINVVGNRFKDFTRH